MKETFNDFNIPQICSLNRASCPITLNELPEKFISEQLYLLLVFITRQQFSETSFKMIMAWVILSPQILRNLLQVTRIYSCGLHSSLAVHIWLMSTAETTLFSKSHWFVMWYWKILNRIKVHKLQNVVLQTSYLCFSSVKMSPRAKHSMYTMLLVKE